MHIDALYLRLVVVLLVLGIYVHPVRLDVDEGGWSSGVSARSCIAVCVVSPQYEDRNARGAAECAHRP